LKLKD